MCFSKHANITISTVIVRLSIAFFSCFLLTILGPFLVNKYVLKNFDFIKIFSSISNLQTF